MIEELQAVIEDLVQLKQSLEHQNNKSKIVIETMIQHLEITDGRLNLRMFNTSNLDLTHFTEIIKRQSVVRDNFASLSYPPKIRITIERID